MICQPPAVRKRFICIRIDLNNGRAGAVKGRSGLDGDGVGGIIVPFIGIKAIDMFLVALHLA